MKWSIMTTGSFNFLFDSSRKALKPNSDAISYLRQCPKQSHKSKRIEFFCIEVDTCNIPTFAHGKIVLASNQLR